MISERLTNSFGVKSQSSFVVFLDIFLIPLGFFSFRHGDTENENSLSHIDKKIQQKAEIYLPIYRGFCIRIYIHCFVHLFVFCGYIFCLIHLFHRHVGRHVEIPMFGRGGIGSKFVASREFFFSFPFNFGLFFFLAN